SRVRILLLGASGFIGRELFAALAVRGHRVVAAVRDPEASPPFSSEPAIRVDLNGDTRPEAWLPRLAGIDAVVNCAGILQASRGQSIGAIHRDGPIALFKACAQAGVRRVVQISAISATTEAATAYATTKLAADDYLRSTALEWVVLRPSLVHARGAFGGTALFRGMAALPFAIPVPGDGGQRFQPIHVSDLSRVVVLALEGDTLVRQTLEPVGPEAVALRTILEDYRRWLGFGGAPVIAVPRTLVRLACRAGDLAGGPLNSTSLAQLEHGNTGDAEAFSRATGISPRGWKESLAAEPAHAQDRWHARLFFVRPALRYALAFLWIISGVTGLIDLRAWALLMVSRLSIGIGTALAGLALACAIDLLIAVLLLRRWKPRRLAFIQVAAIAAYTAGATVLWPSLWVEPLGPLFKNVPIAVAVLAWGAIEEDR
ncbi:MAG: SDR family oxidoreductase, partial [Burkholderiales bacterium]|nr:SDR family oxidoreductase [Burkholderiales bacterium]